MAYSCGSGRDMCYTGTGRVLASRAGGRGAAGLIRLEVPTEFRISTGFLSAAGVAALLVVAVGARAARLADGFTSCLRQRARAVSEAVRVRVRVSTTHASAQSRTQTCTYGTCMHACSSCRVTCSSCRGACITCRGTCSSCRGACSSCRGACSSCRASSSGRGTCSSGRGTCSSGRGCSSARGTCSSGRLEHRWVNGCMYGWTDG